jgi:hypothetical protein
VAVQPFEFPAASWTLNVTVFVPRSSNCRNCRWH